MPPTNPGAYPGAAILFRTVRRRHPAYHTISFAQYAGIQRALLGQYEIGAISIPLDVLYDLANFLDDPIVVIEDFLARFEFLMIHAIPEANWLMSSGSYWRQHLMPLTVLARVSGNIGSWMPWDIRQFIALVSMKKRPVDFQTVRC